MKTSIIKNKGIRKLVIALLWIGLWQLAWLIIKKEILLVSPFDVIKTIFLLRGTAEFWYTVFASLIRILLGFLSAVIFGCLLSAVTFRFRFLYEFFYPAISVIKATPVASFIILALVWIQTNGVPVFISFLMVFPVIWTNVTEGLQQIDKDLMEMAKVYEFSWVKKLKLIILPSVFPYLISACVAGIGLTWKSGIAAEVIARPKLSMGGRIYDAKIYLETPELFAWTAMVILMSVCVEFLFRRCVRIIASRGFLKYKDVIK